MLESTAIRGDCWLFVAGQKVVYGTVSWGVQILTGVITEGAAEHLELSPCAKAVGKSTPLAHDE